MYLLAKAMVYKVLRASVGFEKANDPSEEVKQLSKRSGETPPDVELMMKHH